MSHPADRSTEYRKAKDLMWIWEELYKIQRRNGPEGKVWAANSALTHDVLSHADIDELAKLIKEHHAKAPANR